MTKTKIVFMGAGSLCFGPAMLRDVFSCKDLAGSTLAMVDIDKEALDRMYATAVELNKASGLNMTLEKSVNRRDVFSGADFVVSSICVERCRLWELDFTVPKKYGIRHPLGENGGPGALFFTLRTIPMILDIVRDMEDLCPNAYFFNFSNPESRIVLAIGRYSKIKSVGLCHGILIGQHQVATMLGKKPKEVEVLGAGLNHFQWLLQVRDAETAEDLYPKLREINKTYDQNYERFSRKLFSAFGYFPSCGGGHIGEYLPYGYEAGEGGYGFAQFEEGRANFQKELDARLAKKGGDDWSDWLKPSGERAVDVLTAVQKNSRQLIPSGIIYNKGGAITNLPYDAAVEVPIAIDVCGINPVSVTLPEPLARILTAEVMVQQMSVDAAVNGSKEMALQTLLMDRVVNSTDAAVKLLDELWEHNKPYIRKCI